MNRGPEKIGRLLGAIVVLVLFLLLSSCSTYRLSTLNYDPIYGPEDVVLTVPSDVKIDTIDSYFQLRSKLRNNFRFRWDFAQYAMQQPYSWYWNNPRLENFWRPYNRFDVYFYSNWFWNDWAFNYPYHSYWGMNSWYRPWGWNSWNRPYDPWNNWYQGPWHNPGYNVVWNSSRRGVAYVNGPRGSRIGSNSIIQRDNNIKNKIVRRYNKQSNMNNIINNVINELRENFNVKPRVYNNPNNVPNNGRPIINDNINNNNIRGSWRPNNNNSINNNNYSNIYTRPATNNNNSTVRPSSTISRGNSSSRGGNSNRRK